MFSDLPYGVLNPDEAPWDTLLTADELTQMIENFEAVSAVGAYVIGFWCHWGQLGMIQELLKNHQFTLISPITWYKNDQNYVGGQDAFTFATETLVCARKIRRQGASLYVNMDKNPVKRHNIIIGPTQSSKDYLKDENGRKINPCQKPTYLFKTFLGWFARPGDTVVIVGTGAGGEVQAAIEFGVNVKGFETDDRQIKALAGHLTTVEFQMKKSVRADKLKKKQHAAAAEDLLVEAEDAEDNDDVSMSCHVCDIAHSEQELDYMCPKCGSSIHTDCAAIDAGADGKSVCKDKKCKGDLPTWRPAKKAKIDDN